MHKELLARRIRVGKGRVCKLMQQHGIKAKTLRKFVVSRHSLPVAPDLVQRRFNPEAPNQPWSGDITYIATDEGWLYLAAVIDLFSRQEVGWSMQAHMQISLVKDALSMAWFRLCPQAGLIFHCDRGSQGVCIDPLQRAPGRGRYRAFRRQQGDSYENALAEPINGLSLYKAEMIHRRGPGKTREAVEATLEWVSWFNHHRLL